MHRDRGVQYIVPGKQKVYEILAFISCALTARIGTSYYSCTQAALDYIGWVVFPGAKKEKV